MPPARTPSRSGAGDHWRLAAIVLVGVALRAAWARYATRPPVGLHDPTFYLELAERLADGLGYSLPSGEPTAYYPVGYPGALGALFWLADRTPLPDDRMALVVGLNLVAAAVSIVVVAAIGRLVFDRRVGLLAAAVLAVMPSLVLHSALALTETVFNALALLAVLVVVAGAWPSPSRTTLVAFGVLVGLAALVRPPSLLFLPVLAVAGWRAAGWGWREAVRATAIPAAAALAVLLPWTVRNVRAMGAPVLISTNTGDNLCIGHNPEADGSFGLTPSCMGGDEHLPRPEHELRRDADGRARAIEFLTEEPGEQLRLVPRRAFHTFKDDLDALAAAESYGDDLFLDRSVRRPLELVANVVFFTTLALGSAAVVVLGATARARHPDRTFVVLAAASLAAVPLAFFGDPRFHVPVLPFLVLGTAALVVAVADRRRAA